MIFRIEGRKLKDTGTSFTPVGKWHSMFAVGDTFKGWLSDRRERQCATELKRRMKTYGLAEFRVDVLERGNWEIVCCFNDL